MLKIALVKNVFPAQLPPYRRCFAALMLYATAILPASMLQAQNVGIGTTTMPFAKLHVTNDVDGNPAAISVENRKTGGQRYGVSSVITHTEGAALAGITMDEGGGTSGIGNGHYGVVGIAGQMGTAIGAFTVGGLGIRSDAGPFGMALYTSGQLRFQFVGENEGYVLTSDAMGNAQWKTLAGTHHHYGESWEGDAATGISISTSSDGTAIAGYNTNPNDGGGVRGFATGAIGQGVLGISWPDGNYHPLPNTESAGVVGSSGVGAGVYAASVSGTSLHAIKGNYEASAGSVGIFENQKVGLSAPVVLIKGIGSQPALELGNGYLKVSGDNRTVFQIVAGTGSSLQGSRVWFTYPGISATDMLIVTHVLGANGIGAVGVVYDALTSQ